MQLAPVRRTYSGYNIGTLMGDPEDGQTQRELSAGVEIAQVKDHVGDEAALNDAKQASTDEEGCPSREEGLHARNETPCYHLNRNPSISADSISMLAASIPRSLRWQVRYEGFEGACCSA